MNTRPKYQESRMRCSGMRTSCRAGGYFRSSCARNRETNSSPDTSARTSACPFRWKPPASIATLPSRRTCSALRMYASVDVTTTFSPSTYGVTGHAMGRPRPSRNAKMATAALSAASSACLVNDCTLTKESLRVVFISDVRYNISCRRKCQCRKW